MRASQLSFFNILKFTKKPFIRDRYVIAYVCTFGWELSMKLCVKRMTPSERNNTMKKIVSFILILCILSGMCVAYATVHESRAVIGADLTDEQVAAVYGMFDVTKGSVTQMTVTNKEERQYLEGYVDESIIGTRSISCVYIELLDEGDGMDVTTSNITWCTPEMYMAALATAGITDAKIIVAAPFEVSGTAALTGVYKAYEDMTGQKLSELAKTVSTQELTITGELAEEIGSLDSTAIVQELKLMLDETQNMTDQEIKDQIIAIAQQYNVTLTDSQIDQLISLCRSLEGLDVDQLKDRVKEVQSTLNKLSEAKTQVVGFVDKVKKVVTSIASFFDKIKDILGFAKAPNA